MTKVSFYVLQYGREPERCEAPIERRAADAAASASVATGARLGAAVTQEGKDRLLLACRIAEKALRAEVGNSSLTYIYCPDTTVLATLDDLLWTFRQGSFVAHERLETVRDWNDAAPVIIGNDEPAKELNGVLINLATDVPLFFSRFERVAEIIDNPGRESGRQRYQFYKDRGYPLETHKIEAE